MSPALESSPRVLFFCHRLFGRDVVEVVQRWPVEYGAVTYGGWREGRTPPTLGMSDYLAWRTIRATSEMNEKTRAYILQRLQDEFALQPQVMVVDPAAWQVLDEEWRELIWTKVENGMGLVYSTPSEEFRQELKARGEVVEEPLILAIQMPNLPLLRPVGHQVGKGRVVTFDRNPPAGIRFLCPLYVEELPFEAAMAQAILSIQWAADENDAIRITEIEVPEKIDWPVGGADELKVTIAAESKHALRADVRFFDSMWREVGNHSQEIQVQEGTNEVPLALPKGPQGALVATIRLFDGDFIRAFGAASVTVESPTSLAIEPVTELIDSGEVVEARLTANGVESGDNLIVELYDNFDRLVARQSVEAKDGEQIVKLNDPNPLTRYQRLEARLSRGDQLLVRSDAPLLRKIPYDPLIFRNFAWRSHGDTFYIRNHLNHMSSLGLNSAFSPGSGEVYNRAAIRHNLDLVSITDTGPHPKVSDAQLVQMTSEEYIQEDIDKLLGFIREAENLGGQWAFNHGDELYLRGWDPKIRDVTQQEVRDAFVAYLQGSYNDDIASLNEAWGTNFASFEAMEVPEDIDVPGDPRAPWLDYCLFFTDVFCGYYERLNEAAHAEFPDAVIGIDGIEQFSQFDGIDWYRLQNSQNGIVIYPHEDHDNKLYSWRSGLSFMPRHGFNGYWIAYDSDFVPEVAAGYPWRALFAGLGSLGYFQAYDEADPYAAMYPDWQARPTYEAMTDEVRLIQSGIDRLLLGAYREHSPIAVHYSPRSWALSFPSAGIEHHVNQLGQYNIHRIYRGYDGHVAANASGFLALLLDIGYQPQMVATEQIEAGALKDYKLLILPYSQSLTDEEVKAIRQFVEEGGTVMADYRTGIRDGRGNLRPDGGVLDDLFGIHQPAGEDKPLISEQPMTIGGFIRNDQREEGGDYAYAVLAERIEQAIIGGPVSVTEEGLEADSGGPSFVAGISHGETQDGTPVFFYNRVGKGAAIYLNFSLEPYLLARNSDDAMAQPYVDVLREVVGEVSHVPLPVYVTQVGQGFSGRRAWMGVPEIGAEVSRFKDGDAEYVGLAWKWKRPDWSEREVQARFITPSHLYDPLEGEYLGYTDRAAFEIEGAVPTKLLARMPYRVEELAVTASASNTAPGESISFDANIVPEGTASAGRHVIRITVLDETETELETEGAILDAPEGQLAYTWQVPYNMPEGAYEVRFTDVATGVSSTAEVTIQ